MGVGVGEGGGGAGGRFGEGGVRWVGAGVGRWERRGG